MYVHNFVLLQYIMGHQLQSFQGAVLFIDILGFGALTKGQIKLGNKEIYPWVKKRHPKNNQFLAASILVKFREILQELDNEFPNVTIAQLSDCFFAWTPSIKNIVRFAHRYMHLSIQHGVLCRGGMAHGEIIETERNHALGRLILGEAVTTAVNLESPAKGARLLIDQELPTRLYNEDPVFSNTMYDMFQPFENPLDYQVYDEFQWYLVNQIDNLPDCGVKCCSAETRLEFTKHRLKLANHLLYDPKFGWNARNLQGKIHLQATNNFLTKNGLNSVSHEFERRGFPKNRSIKKLTNAHELIDNDTGYLIIR